MAMGTVSLSGAEELDELAEAYWKALCKISKQHDEPTRRFLIVSGVPQGAAPEIELLVRTWLPCVTGVPLPSGELQAVLRSGEYLVSLVNALRPGIVTKVARAADLTGISESKANAMMRENIGQYIDACADLGVLQRDLFTPDDLFDNKDMRAVLRNLEALARLASQPAIPDFDGPFIGKRLVKGAPKKYGAAAGGGGGGWSVQTPHVVLSGGVRGGYQAAVSGGGR